MQGHDKNENGVMIKHSLQHDPVIVTVYVIAFRAVQTMVVEESQVKYMLNA